MNSFAFIPGELSSRSQPLEAFLPQVPSSTFSIWLEDSSPLPNFHLDPFGSSPHLLLDGARHGYRILVAVNNPVLHFTLTYLAPAPSPADLKSALATLSSSFKGEERLEPHILSLYETECPHCGRKISAQGFIWKKEGAAPERKICHCQHCHNQGEYPTSALDIEKAHQHQENSLYHARALTRIAPPDDPIRTQAESALHIYTPRAVYALFTLVNKLSGLPPDDPDRSHISALLLHAFYAANSLWSPSRKIRNSQKLSRPATYFEKNVWHSLEEAVEIWHREAPAVEVNPWPQLPPEDGGITLFPGRFRELSEELNDDIGAGLMVVPQPNPIFWSLSALWAGWLWGQEQAAPLRRTLSLQDPDWDWYTQALTNTFSALYNHLEPDSPIFAVLPNLRSEFMASTLTASHASRFQVQGLAVEPHHRQAQIVWQPREPSLPTSVQESLKAILRNAGYSHLTSRGEPSYGLLLEAAGLTALDEERALPPVEEMDPDQIYQTVRNVMDETYAYRQGFLHFPDSDTWWHQELDLDVSPLSDRVEKKMVELLLEKQSPIPGTEIRKALHDAFPGLLTPNAALIEVCLASYGEETPPGSDRWRLKDNERPAARRSDIQEMQNLLDDLGRRLDYTVTQRAPRGSVQICSWLKGEKPKFTFFISASGMLGKLIQQEPQIPPGPWIVVPGSRAHLVVFKLSQNQPLANLIEEDWGFIKYRHLRRLVDDESLTTENIEERFRLDPLKYDAPQLPLI